MGVLVVVFVGLFVWGLDCGFVALLLVCWLECDVLLWLGFVCLFSYMRFVCCVITLLFGICCFVVGFIVGLVVIFLVWGWGGFVV